MKTPDEIIQFLSGPTIIDNLTDILRENEPSFTENEKRYLDASSILRNEIEKGSLPSVDEYLSAYNIKVCANLLYAAYLGYRVNLKNFHSPCTIDFTKMDFTDYIRDHLTGHFPVCRAADSIIESFQNKLPETLKPLADEIKEYFIFLDTYGPKISHYMGYMTSNKLLYWVEPGYQEDFCHTDMSLLFS